jgi:hypothetical protein
MLSHANVAQAQAPSNDEPCQALQLAYNGPDCNVTGGTTVGASSSSIIINSSVAACDPVTTVKDVWYVMGFSSGWPTNVEVTISVLGGAASDVRVFQVLNQPSCSQTTLAQLACSRASGPNIAAPDIVMRPVPGALLYVRVGGYDANSTGGPFSICRRETAIPTCQQPPSFNQAAVRYTPTSATITYLPNIPAQLVLTAPGNVQTTRVFAGSPIVLTGLTENTVYSATLANICSSTGQVSPATPLLLRTPLSSRYCTTALGGNCLFSSISNVQIINTTLNHSEGCFGSADGAYTGVAATSASRTATLVRGQTYQLRVNTGSNPGGNNSNVAFWIDFNNNGVFDTNEYTAVQGFASPVTPAVATFTVPADATPGLVGLRVRSALVGSQFTAAGACALTPGQYGETEDYTLVIDQILPVRSAVLAAAVGLFPTPTRHSFTLQLPVALSQQPVEAVLRNSVGQVQQLRTLPAAATGIEAQFSVAGLAKGVYTLHLRTGAGAVVKRVVVE